MLATAECRVRVNSFEHSESSRTINFMCQKKRHWPESRIDHFDIALREMSSLENGGQVGLLIELDWDAQRLSLQVCWRIHRRIRQEHKSRTQDAQSGSQRDNWDTLVPGDHYFRDVTQRDIHLPEGHYSDGIGGARGRDDIDRPTFGGIEGPRPGLEKGVV